MVRDTSAATGLQGAIRIAGFCYVVIIALGLFNAALVAPRLPAFDDSSAVVAVVLDEAFRFRFGVLIDSVLYALVLVLSVALYLVVRRLDQGLALGALVLRSAEAVVGLSATVVGGLGAVLLLSDPAGVDPMSVVALLAVRESALDVILILVGLGGAAYCHLFFQSRIVPRTIALWGVGTYASMVVLGASRILWPSVPPSVTSLLYAQGAVFEVVFGSWLVMKAGDIARRVEVYLQ